MKDIGMIRKIDDLGRVVIPKEIRKNLGLKSEDYLEIFIDNNNIVLKKYIPINNVYDNLNKMFIIFGEKIKSLIFLTDKEKIILANDCSSNLLGRLLGKDIINAIRERKIYESKEIETKKVFEGDEQSGCFYIYPIIIDSECYGSIFMISSDLEEKKISMNYFELLIKLIISTI